ncbi:hypothetical protein RTBOTA2_003491 [Rhodotorula toruloides]|nr:hypothetical protein RTBOTA2_003491 [Rhodotorula toruloides]
MRTSCVQLLSEAGVSWTSVTPTRPEGGVGGGLSALHHTVNSVLLQELAFSANLVCGLGLEESAVRRVREDVRACIQNRQATQKSATTQTGMKAVQYAADDEYPTLISNSPIVVAPFASVSVTLRRKPLSRRLPTIPSIIPKSCALTVSSAYASIPHLNRNFVTIQFLSELFRRR